MVGPKKKNFCQVLYEYTGQQEVKVPLKLSVNQNCIKKRAARFMPAARFFISYSIRTPTQLFKMDWLLMSIVLLCIMAMLLYALINLLEKWCLRHY